MASFGDGVSALLETYTKCLHLLKAFRGRGSKADSVDPTFSEIQSLRGSLRSDRAQVRHAYSAKLSRNGKRLERGDARAKSALRRILERLRAAIMNILGMAKTQTPMMDYGALVSLSNASRVDAIKTMDRLSSRLSSSSSVIQEKRESKSRTSSHSSRNSSKRSSRRHGNHGGGAIQDPAKDRASQATAPGAKISKDKANTSRRKPQRHGSRPKNEPEHDESRSANSSVATVSRDNLQARVSTRISYVSMSSDSTKLGEIPHRRSRLVKRSDGSSADEYSTQPAYPLHPYEVPAREKKGLLRRIFGSSDS